VYHSPRCGMNATLRDAAAARIAAESGDGARREFPTGMQLGEKLGGMKGRVTRKNPILKKKSGESRASTSDNKVAPAMALEPV
jgi:hypothetical protein